ncbi:hypothetical protein J3E68DRAFT_416475 [Trichoderma sp. SZMC 28012]
MSSRMASLRGTVSLQLQPLYTHTLPPECSLPCQKSGLVRRHAEQSLYCTSIFVLCSLSALLEFIPFSIPRMQTKTLHFLLFIRSADFLPCKYLLASALTRSGQGPALRTASPRFGEILNLTGCLINTYPYPRCRNSLCVSGCSPLPTMKKKNMPSSVPSARASLYGDSLFFSSLFSFLCPISLSKSPPLQAISSSLFSPLMSPSTGCILHILTQY